jgi:hypothetical protein
VTARAASVGPKDGGKSPRIPAAQPEPAAQSASSPIALPPPRRSRTFLIVAAVLAACWGVTLSLLAYYTANPVTLNYDQVVASPYVVTGTVAGDPAAGQVTVEREWKKHALTGTITVQNLAASGARSGKTYILPLSRPGEALRVTIIPFGDGTPLIYPATPDALKQLQTMLEPLPNHPHLEIAAPQKQN